MKKTIHLAALFFAGLIVMMQSASAVEYRIANDHKVSVLDLKIVAMEKLLTRCSSVLKNVQWTERSQTEWERFTTMFSVMKTGVEDSPPISAGIQLLLQVLIGFIVFGLVLILVVVTMMAIIVGFLLSSMIVVLMSIVILLVNIFNPSRSLL